MCHVEQGTACKRGGLGAGRHSLPDGRSSLQEECALATAAFVAAPARAGVANSPAGGPAPGPLVRNSWDFWPCRLAPRIGNVPTMSTESQPISILSETE